MCEAREKLSQLAAFWRAHSKAKSIVYLLTCAHVDYLQVGPFAAPRVVAVIARVCVLTVVDAGN